MTHLVSTREGLYVLSNTLEKVMDGAFFGIARRGHIVYFFDRRNAEFEPGSPCGRILSCHIVKGNIFGWKQQLSGLDAGGHQMVLYKNHLYLLETHIQRILRVEIDDDGDLLPHTVQHLYPWKKGCIHHHAQTKEDYENYLHPNAITVQDDRFYVMCANFKSEKTTSKIQVFSPRWDLIDEYNLEKYFCHDCVILGHEIYFCDCFNTIYKLNIVTRQVHACKRLLDAPQERCHCRGLSISTDMTEGVVSSMYNGRAIIARFSQDTYTYTQLKDSATYITRLDGEDYNNSEIKYKVGCVTTLPREVIPFFKDQAEKIDEIFERVQKEDWIVRRQTENVPTLEEFLNPKCEIEDQVFFTGNDVVVTSLQSSREMKTLMSSKIFSHVLFPVSGPFYYYPPMCGRGWHTNQDSIELSPHLPVRCYSIRTTGGTFFFYKHPFSGQIHALHDIDKTVNIFCLRHAPDSFWHAVGSFYGHRLSVGFQTSVSAISGLPNALAPVRCT